MYTKVICNKCNGESITEIDDKYHIVTWKKVQSIISGRFRLDNQWGWQCTCGNNTIMSDQEKQSIQDYRMPTPKEIEEIKNNLLIQPDNNFRMEQV